jgi:hypothetical protein
VAAELFGINVVDGGAVALLGLVFLFVVTGKLVPRRTYEDVLVDRNNWRDAALNSEAARQKEHEQTGELIEIARLGGNVLAALPKPGQHSSEEVNADAGLDPAPRART